MYFNDNFISFDVFVEQRRNYRRSGSILIYCDDPVMINVIEIREIVEH